ncbi:hypothetical protein N8D56_24140 [Devosia sp. A8/3-2]|nr:hypothetical protein N8D56_24140 [Devosia sp. A8/3-2]
MSGTETGKGQARGLVGIGQIWRKDEIERDADQRDGHGRGEQAGIELLDRRGAAEAAGEGERDGGDQRFERDEATAPIGEGGHGGADHALQLVGGKGRDRRQAGRQKRRNTDHAATAGNGIDKAGQHADRGQREKNQWVGNHVGPGGSGAAACCGGKSRRRASRLTRRHRLRYRCHRYRGWSGYRRGDGRCHRGRSHRRHGLCRNRWNCVSGGAD